QDDRGVARGRIDGVSEFVVVQEHLADRTIVEARIGQGEAQAADLKVESFGKASVGQTATLARCAGFVQKANTQIPSFFRPGSQRGDFLGVGGNAVATRQKVSRRPKNPFAPTTTFKRGSHLKGLKTKNQGTSAVASILRGWQVVSLKAGALQNRQALL